MKHSILPLTFLFPILAAAAASAQVAPIRFDSRLNPLSVLPEFIPRPEIAPIIIGITLPKQAPALVPSLTSAVSAPVSAAPAQPAREEAGLRFNPQDAPSDPAVAGPDASNEKYGRTFDGGNAPPKPAVERPRRRLVSTARHVSLPEWDLERELGL